ncbi:hypothetical protein R3P38DRAFT_3179643 [Favolaschia claudopus]|uniref:Uncharacterized protein n=1 Tax=Favolaschia claudopus TaxID=2862362 RepID=A0AAW0CPV3_9AGAR
MPKDTLKIAQHLFIALECAAMRLASRQAEGIQQSHPFQVSSTRGISASSRLHLADPVPHCTSPRISLCLMIVDLGYKQAIVKRNASLPFPPFSGTDDMDVEALATRLILDRLNHSFVARSASPRPHHFTRPRYVLPSEVLWSLREREPRSHYRDTVCVFAAPRAVHMFLECRAEAEVVDVDRQELAIAL